MKTKEEAFGVEKRLLTAPEMQAYIGQGETNSRRWCDKIGATRHFGRRVLFDRKVIDTALDKMRSDIDVGEG